MSDPLGLSVGTTNLVAARVGNSPVTRRSMLTLAKSGGTISGFVERVGDRVPLVTPDGTSYRAEQLLMQALDAMVEVGGGPSPDVAIAIPAHWSPATIWAFRGALGTSRLLAQHSEQVRVVSDAVAALTALQANPGIAVNGVVGLLDFGGSGTSITLADAAASFEPVGETVRYPDFSGDLVDQALLAHVLDTLSDKADPAGTAAVESLTKLREECRRAKERLSADTATQLVLDFPGYRADIRLTRDELQELIRRPLEGVVSAFDDLTERNGTSPTALAIVGGGANIPLVAQRLSEHTQLPVVTTPQPALNAAVGAALFAAFGADADAPTGVNAATALDAGAPTGAAPAATDVTAAEPVYDGPGPDAPGSATFRALAWSQEEGGEELIPYTGENPYLVADSDVRPVIEYAPATGRVAYSEPRRPWHRVAALGIGVAAVIAIVTVGGVAYALTSATESPRATEEPKPPEPKPPQPKPPEPKQPEPQPPAPPKQENPLPPPPESPPPPPETVTITSEAPPQTQTWTPTTTVPTTTRTTTTTSPTTTTTSPTTTTTSETTTTTTSTTPSMTTTYVRVPFVPVPVPIQVPNQGPPPPPAYQAPVYPQGPWG